MYLISVLIAHVMFNKTKQHCLCFIVIYVLSLIQMYFFPIDYHLYADHFYVWKKKLLKTYSVLNPLSTGNLLLYYLYYVMYIHVTFDLNYPFSPLFENSLKFLFKTCSYLQGLKNTS